MGTTLGPHPVSRAYQAVRYSHCSSPRIPKLPRANAIRLGTLRNQDIYMQPTIVYKTQPEAETASIAHPRACLTHRATVTG